MQVHDFFAVVEEFWGAQKELPERSAALYGRCVASHSPEAVTSALEAFSSKQSGRYRSPPSVEDLSTLLGSTSKDDDVDRERDLLTRRLQARAMNGAHVFRFGQKCTLDRCGLLDEQGRYMRLGVHAAVWTVLPIEEMRHLVLETDRWQQPRETLLVKTGEE